MFQYLNKHPNIKNKLEIILKIYQVLIISAGSWVVWKTVSGFDLDQLNLNLVTLAVLVFIFCGKLGIELKVFKVVITISDTFVFIAIFTLPFESAMVVALFEVLSLYGKFRDNSLFGTLYIIGAVLTKYWLTVALFEYFFCSIHHFVEHLELVDFIEHFFYFFLVSFLAHTVTNLHLLKASGKNTNWRDLYFFQLWSGFTILVGACVAAVCLRLTGLQETDALLISAVCIGCFYLILRSYLNNFEGLLLSESRFRSSFDNAPIGMAVISSKGDWLSVNDQFRKMLKLESDSLPQQRLKEFICESDIKAIEEQMKLLEDGKISSLQSEVCLLTTEKEKIWTIMGASRVVSVVDGQYFNFIIQLQDITLRYQAEEMLRYDAHHDSLTHLNNRNSFKIELQKTIGIKKKQPENVFAVLFIDLDNFKLINDSLGHNKGDELLKNTAHRLLESVHGHDLVARLGGDEFTILLRNLANPDEATIVAQRILNNFSRAVELNGTEYFVGLSIGVAVCNSEYETSDEMLRDADAAMYNAKSMGKNRFSVFDPHLFTQSARKLYIINELTRSIENSEIVLHFQPIHYLQSRKLKGFEVLSRWTHPIYGEIPPWEFIPIAEEYGIIQQLDRWVLLNACRQMREFQECSERFEDLMVSVNISASLFSDDFFIGYVTEVLEKTGLNPASLKIEITETSLIKDIKKAIETLNILNSMGVKIMLDDFGTGYSSLSYLRELPIETLKIDRSFIQRIESNEADRDILQTIIVLAKKLNIKVTAEGIETAKQNDFLIRMDCDFGQGYYYSRPIDRKTTLSYIINERSLMPINAVQTDLFQTHLVN